MKRQDIANDKQAGDKRDKHTLYFAVGKKIQHCLGDRFTLLRDASCEGRQERIQHLPLFMGKEKKPATRICCADLLILSSGRINGIIEVEESSFIPTEIRGKFFQAVLAPHFIPDGQGEDSIPYYADKAIFIQVLDSSSLKEHSRKEAQARLIEQEIQGMLPLGGITKYRLFTVSGRNDHAGLEALGQFIQAAFI